MGEKRVSALGMPCTVLPVFLTSMNVIPVMMFQKSSGAKERLS